MTQLTGKERININVDKELKKETIEVLNDLGLDMTTAITLFMKQVTKKKKIPFEISTKRYYTVEDVAGKDWKAGLVDVEDEWE